MSPKSAKQIKSDEAPRISDLTAGRSVGGQIFVLPEADLQEYKTFTGAFHVDMQPKGAVELNLVHQYADVNWRINHSAAIEKIKTSLTIDDQRDTVDTECAPAHNAFVEARNYHLHSETLRNISLYEMRLATRALKLHKQITEIQATRLAREEKEMEKAALLYELDEETAATAAPGRQFTYNPPEDGFVFSNAKIQFHIRLRDRLILGRRSAKTRTAVV